MTVSFIAAVSLNGVIGKSGDLPWSFPDDMAFFKKVTKGHSVIMGRKNFESIPHRFRPLPHRDNYIITRQENYTADGCYVLNSMEDAIARCRENGEDEIFIIGGAQIYRHALKHDLANRMYITWIHKNYPGDTFFPAIDFSRWKTQTISVHPADERHEAPFSIIQYDFL